MRIRDKAIERVSACGVYWGLVCVVVIVEIQKYFLSDCFWKTVKDQSVAITGLQVGFEDRQNRYPEIKGKGDKISIWWQLSWKPKNLYSSVDFYVRAFDDESGKLSFLPKVGQENWIKLCDYTRMTNKNYERNFQRFEKIKLPKQLVLKQSSSHFLQFIHKKTHQ